MDGIDSKINNEFNKEKKTPKLTSKESWPGIFKKRLRTMFTSAPIPHERIAKANHFIP